MYQGKHTNQAANRSAAPRRKRRLRWRREFVLFCSIVVLLIGVVGGSLAYLATSTEDVTNTFTPAKIDIEIIETFDKETKKDVAVTNKCDYPVYARATYVAYWVSDTDSSVLAEAPVLSGSGVNTAKWTYRAEDGYWYYNHIVPANGTTDNFINEFTATAKDGCHLVIDVIAETVQASPEQAVMDVWGFRPTVS